MAPYPTIPATEARLLHLRLQGLAAAPVRPLSEVLGRLGYVQLDPLNVCGRMHDLILRNRVSGYAAGRLLDWLHGVAGEGTVSREATRGGFEQFLPGAGVLVAYPWDAWPYLQPILEERRRSPRGYHGRLSAEEERLAARILAELAERGPLTSDDIAHDGRGTTAWGSPAKTVKIVLEKLFAHGRVLLARRRAFRRVYDLPERIVPEGLRSGPRVSDRDAELWRLLLLMRQRRLVRLNSRDAGLLGDRVVPVSVEGVTRLFVLSEDVSDNLIQTGRAGDVGAAAEPLLLAPLDPLIYDRALTRSLWDFDYTWEVYTPAHKRKRGYYALPVLSGNALVGHVEPRFDAVRGRMAVLSRRVRRGHATTGALASLARCLAADARAGVSS